MVEIVEIMVEIIKKIVEKITCHIIAHYNSILYYNNIIDSNIV